MLRRQRHSGWGRKTRRILMRICARTARDAGSRRLPCPFAVFYLQLSRQSSRSVRPVCNIGMGSRTQRLATKFSPALQEAITTHHSHRSSLVGATNGLLFGTIPNHRFSYNDWIRRRTQDLSLGILSRGLRNRRSSQLPRQPRGITSWPRAVPCWQMQCRLHSTAHDCSCRTERLPYLFPARRACQTCRLRLVPGRRPRGAMAVPAQRIRATRPQSNRGFLLVLGGLLLPCRVPVCPHLMTVA